MMATNLSDQNDDTEDDAVIIQVGFRAPKGDIKRFTAIAKKRQMSREALFRECMLDKIEEYPCQQKS